MSTLKNKTVIVTGASSGIGMAAAGEFLNRGARVVMAARRLERLQMFKEGLNEGQSSRCLIHQTDLTRREEIETLIRRVEAEWGVIDILVNAAGIGLKAGILEIDPEDWNTAVATNYSAVFFMTQAVTRSMVANKVRGVIITISSMAGLFNVPGYSGYCSSKHAVTSFMHSISAELKKLKIRTCTIHPYKVDTAFFDSYERRPGRFQMLSSGDIARLIAAIAEKNSFKAWLIRINNFIKRFYYAIRYTSK
jgi:NADP-dependent 3-hydroxy acid dehydrogenase YdfG